jgi:hypothetical protein
MIDLYLNHEFLLDGKAIFAMDYSLPFLNGRAISATDCSLPADLRQAGAF